MEPVRVRHAVSHATITSTMLENLIVNGHVQGNNVIPVHMRKSMVQKYYRLNKRQ